MEKLVWDLEVAAMVGCLSFELLEQIYWARIGRGRISLANMLFRSCSWLFATAIIV